MDKTGVTASFSFMLQFFGFSNVSKLKWHIIFLFTHTCHFQTGGCFYENICRLSYARSRCSARKIENIPFFRCGTEYIDLLLIRAVGIQASAELEIGSIVRTQLATVRGTVRTFSSGDHMVHGVLNMAQSFVSLVAHLASPRFSSGAIRSL